MNQHALKAQPAPVCCLCGLLCPVPMQWPANGEQPGCQRLRNWLSDQDARASQLPHFDTATEVSSVADRLRRSARPLLWLESADVETTRAAVRLAEACEGTIHVADSTATHNLADVVGTHGTLGSSLATMRNAATLVVHLGSQHLREMPLLADRFLTSQQSHLFLDGPPDESLPGVRKIQDSLLDLGWHWPSDSWQDRFARLLLALRDESSVMRRAVQGADLQAAELAEQLLANRYTLFVWSVELFSDEMDCLVLERLNEVANQVSQFTRCALLPLKIDPGRESAGDAVLWLTNFKPPVAFQAGQWQSADSIRHKSLDQWRSEYDTILCVRNLPSDRPLPSLEFDLTLDAACNSQPMHWRESDNGPTAVVEGGQSSHASTRRLLPVAAVGLDVPGNLTRVDHGISLYGRPAESSEGADNLSEKLPLASALLEEIRYQLLSAKDG